MVVLGATVPAWRLASSTRPLPTGALKAPSVPLGRRDFFQDRRRVALTSGGVAVALLLVLLLQGIFAGSMHQVTRYIEDSTLTSSSPTRRHHHAHEQLCRPRGRQ